MAYDAAVIGSGPNGLCAAIALAQAGRSVVVYEAKGSVGGGCRTAELTEPGFRHDVCSAVHPMALGSPYMSTLPLEAHGLQWVLPEAPLAHPLDDGDAVILARDPAATELGEDGPRYARLVRPFVEGWVELARDALAPLRWPGRPLLMARFGMTAFRSAAGLARSRFSGERARALIAGLAAHSALALEEVPSAAIGLMLGICAHAVGWPIPRGGAQSLADALASLFRSLGGAVETGREITALGEVETEGPVLFDTSPGALATIAGDALPAGYRERLGRYRHGPGVFKIDWALDAPIPWRDPACARVASVHVGGTLAELAASERAAFAGEHCERPFVLLAEPTRADPTRAPDGKHVAWAYCHVPNGSSRDQTRPIEDQIERFAPGFRDCVRARHTMSTSDMAAYNANYVGGDIIGGVTDIGQLFSRPVSWWSPYTTPNGRLFMCSSSTPPGTGVHGMCGYHAARAVLARFRD